MVEQPAVNRLVIGSSPIGPAIGRVAELVDALVLETSPVKGCEFESHLGHQNNIPIV